MIPSKGRFSLSNKSWRVGAVNFSRSFETCAYSFYFSRVKTVHKMLEKGGQDRIMRSLGTASPASLQQSHSVSGEIGRLYYGFEEIQRLCCAVSLATVETLAPTNLKKIGIATARVRPLPMRVRRSCRHTFARILLAIL